MGNSFSASSLANIETCEKDLQNLCHLALDYAEKLGRDFSVIEGYRDIHTQMNLFRDGKSRIDGVSQKSKHNYDPSRAIDFVPYLKGLGALVGNDTQIMSIADKYGIEVYSARYKLMGEFAIIANCFFLAAHDLGIKIRWGGDWNQDSNTFNNTFDDMGHIELC